jgi:myo-inositol-1(or 4)-monophosphatase
VESQRKPRGGGTTTRKAPCPLRIWKTQRLLTRQRSTLVPNTILAPTGTLMLQERLIFAKRLALEAGRLTLEGFGRCDEMPKDSVDGYDIATEYDLRTEELVRQRIQREFDEPVLGEEDGLIGDHETAKSRLWIVDPIDGTFNYQRGLPLYGVSIAFCEHATPACGAIFFPALGQLFFASRGEGAFLIEGDRPAAVAIHVSQQRELARLVLGLAGRDFYRLVAACRQEEIPWRSLRHSMCAVFDLVNVATGRMDAYLHSSLSLWDCAAADILLREAGAPAPFDFEGVPIFPAYANRRLAQSKPENFTFVAASSPDLYQELLRRLLSSAGFPLG